MKHEIEHLKSDEQPHSFIEAGQGDTSNYKKLKTEINGMYPDENITDAELCDIADRLIKFCAIGAKTLQEIKTTSIPSKHKLTIQKKETRL